AVRVVRRGDDMVIDDVRTPSKAARAGLRKGDVLLSIAGERPLAPSQARAMLRGASGTRVTLRVKRGGVTRTVELAREEFPEWPED
ncbi:MAG: PDZ domain-containing protein, partial [Myxococcales bacterium]|nr:PDZ domain-containing protein [Myxococcales bacterium]